MVRTASATLPWTGTLARPAGHWTWNWPGDFYEMLTVLGTAKLGGTLNVTLILGDKPFHG